MKMNWPTRILLIVLQLAIGWHLFYEGVWKVQNPSWSSKGYLKNAAGPLALWLRYRVGDPDVSWNGSQLVVAQPVPDLLDRYTHKPFPDPNSQPEPTKLHPFMPPPVEKEWEAYFSNFASNYKLDDAEKAKFRARFETSENEFVEWLLKGEKGVKRPWVSGGAPEIPLTTPVRLKEYRDKVEQAKELRATEVSTFGKPAADKVKRAEAEAAALRQGLIDDLADQTQKMKDSLREALSPEQRRMALPKEETPPAPEWAHLAAIDTTVRWGLLVVGACLLLGFLTRPACVAGAAFLVLFYLAQPALPGMPENPASPGHYLFVNANVVEAVALLAVAASNPGKCYGIDALLHRVWRLVFKPKPEAPAAVTPEPTRNGGAEAPLHVSPRKD
jgi:uncharacterized membrane protein YphA (DoxX/SURF4 family)